MPRSLRSYGAITSKRALSRSDSKPLRLVRLVLSIDSKAPHYRPQQNRMLVVVLWRQRPSLLGHDLATAAFTAIDAGVLWRLAGLPFPIECSVIAGAYIVLTFV